MARFSVRMALQEANAFSAHHFLHPVLSGAPVGSCLVVRLSLLTHINSLSLKTGMLSSGLFADRSRVMLIPKRRTWFFVADGAKARLFESLGFREPWNLKKEWRDDDARLPARDLEKERPGRGHTIGAGARYSIVKRSKHDAAESAFAKARIEFINSALEEFDQLVLAAPPAALGEIRKGLSADVIAKFIGVFDKDLTNMPDQELHEYFQRRLERW